MSFLRAYTAPTDPRWHGPQRRGPFLLLPITFLFIIIWILFISDQIYTRVLQNQYSTAYQKWQKTSNHDYSTMPRSAYWSAFDFIYRGCFALIPELIHLPLTHFLLHKNKLHPVAALSTGLIFACLWSLTVVWAFMLTSPWFTEEQNWTQTAYDRLVLAGAGFEITMTVCYVAYVVFACIAVSRWRKAKRDAAIYRKMDGEKVGEDVELSERV